MDWKSAPLLLLSSSSESNDLRDGAEWLYQAVRETGGEGERMGPIRSQLSWAENGGVHVT